MSSNKDSFGRTIIFIISVCIVCSIVVAGAAVGLKPLQTQNMLDDKQSKILEAAGLLTPEMTKPQVRELFAERVESKLIDLDSGEYIEGDANLFDERRASRDPSQSKKLENDPATISRRADKAAVFLVKGNSGAVETVVLPVHGSGLWDLMFGYVGLEPDLNTVRSVIYSDHKETPGLGALVVSDKWKALWPGKKMFDENNNVAIKIVKGGAKPGDIHGVDALSGATLTSNGVEHTMHFWLGDQGYGAFIEKHRSGGLK